MAAQQRVEGPPVAGLGGGDEIVVVGGRGHQPNVISPIEPRFGLAAAAPRIGADLAQDDQQVAGGDVRRDPHRRRHVGGRLGLQRRTPPVEGGGELLGVGREHLDLELGVVDVERQLAEPGVRQRDDEADPGLAHQRLLVAHRRPVRGRDAVGKGVTDRAVVLLAVAVGVVGVDAGDRRQAGAGPGGRCGGRVRRGGRFSTVAATDRDPQQQRDDERDDEQPDDDDHRRAGARLQAARRLPAHRGTRCRRVVAWTLAHRARRRRLAGDRRGAGPGSRLLARDPRLLAGLAWLLAGLAS